VVHADVIADDGIAVGIVEEYTTTTDVIPDTVACDGVAITSEGYAIIIVRADVIVRDNVVGAISIESYAIFIPDDIIA